MNYNYSIGFIGAGNMTQAFLKALTNKFPEIHSSIYVTNRTLSKAEVICKEFHVNLAKNNVDLVNHCEIIILAVKPYAYEEVLGEIKGYIHHNHIIVSIAAGISINYIEQLLNQSAKIIRTMPNTPVMVGAGMTGIAYNNCVSQKELNIVASIFKSIGEVDFIEEDLMDVVTAISGSSPAIVCMFIEALADGSVLQGMCREKAYKYAAQAVLGGAKLILETKKHPGEFKDMVCTPGGTTIEAVYSLEKNHFRGTVIEAIKSCVEKARFLASK